MTARRVAAVAVAVLLVVGAWLVRSRVIEGDGGDAGQDDTPRTATELVCTPDLENVCASLQLAGVDVVVEDVSVTLAHLGDAPAGELPLWLTLDPLPAMVDSLRAGARADAAGWATTELASSPIVLVSPAAKAAALVAACPEPDRWRCVGELAGSPWSDIDPALGDDVRPAFAPVDRHAVGLVALGQATAGWFGSAPVAVDDPAYFAWLRGLSGAVSERSLSGGTPIRTMLTRPSALDVAVGAQAELGPSPVATVDVTYAGPMTTADVVLAAPAGVTVPSALAQTLTSRLREAGWGVPSDEPSGALPPATLLAVEALWEDIRR